MAEASPLRLEDGGRLLPPFLRDEGKGVWIERALALLVAAGLLHTSWFYLTEGYLPQPFIYDLADPLMDLYWTTWWGYQPGPYSVWNSIYPPLSFVYTRLLSNPACYAGDAFSARDCDVVLRWLAIFAVMVLNAFLVWRAYRRSGTGCAASRAFVVAFGFPALFAADRGNLIIPCFTCFVLAFGHLLQSLAWRAVALAAAINFKPYLLVLLLVPILLRRWVYLAWLCGGGLLIYLLSFTLLDAGTPQDLLSNFAIFRSEISVNYWERVYASTSFAPMVRFAQSDFSWLQLLDSNTLDFLVASANLLMSIGLFGATVVLAVAAGIRRGVETRQLAALILALLFVLSELGGGYAMMFVVFLTFFEPWKGPVRCTMLACAFLLSIPSDFIFLPLLQPTADAWWSGRQVSAEFGAAVGQLLRPLAMVLILYGHILINLRRQFQLFPISATFALRRTS